MKCAACDGDIVSVIDGVFCKLCGNPVHVRCHRPEATGLREGRCAACGGDPHQATAIMVRKEWGLPDAIPAEASALTPTASEYGFAEMLMWGVRLFGVAGIVWAIYGSMLILDAAGEAEKLGRRPDVTAPLALTILGGAGSAILLFAIAEILNLTIGIAKKLAVRKDQPAEQEKSK